MTRRALALIGFNLADLVMTAIALTFLGAREMNPLFADAGLATMFGFKIVMTAFMAWWITVATPLYPRTAGTVFAFAVLFYGSLLTFNATQIVQAVRV